MYLVLSATDFEREKKVNPMKHVIPMGTFENGKNETPTEKKHEHGKSETD